MLTQKLPLRSMAGQLLDDLPGQNMTRGGSSETEPNDPMARPTGTPPSMAVTTVTPVGKCPRTRRNSVESNGATIELGSLRPQAGFTDRAIRVPPTRATIGPDPTAT